ncbi:uncharacterized protein LOC129603888 [Betta splendens]|uniref:Uncharacterized protein LOC129603888 n=1 Tax=Betta splendens TaxID=158456 RepID=A0A9W2XNZ5_BETSP|nr:uncharacterized protein LOC129603888 [Betta splendens]
MITPIFLLCILTRQALCQTKDISPAKIFAPLKTISEGSSLYITCSTFGSKKQSTVYVYLCKDGVGIDTAMQKKEQNDAHFAIRQVSRHDSGHYSCIYSRTKYKPSALNDTGSSRIQIQVIPSFLPADISVAGPSTVSEGNHVELRCTLSKTVQTLGECQLVQSYLTRNDTVVQVQRFNITQMEATFIIEGAVVKDSGSYSCIVLPLKCFEMNKGALYGNNSILVEVKASLVGQVMFYSGIISLMLSLGFCLWMIRHRCGSSKGK